MSPKALALDRLLSRRMSYAENMWADVRDWGGVGARRLMRAEGGSLGGSIWELQPGGSQFVYHFHHGSEELIVVLRGEPTVRLHDGDRWP
jgi:quercetin dioxygenase-like cupin family protein